MVEHNPAVDEHQSIRNPDALSIFARFWLWVFGGMFARIKFFKKNGKLIRKYLSRGAVVHVIQYASYLEYLIFNYYLRRHGLSCVYYPERGLLTRIFDRGSGKRLPDRSVVAGQQYVIFLQRRGSFLSVSADRQVDQILKLLELQKETEVPIFLMPHVTIWSRYPVSMIKSFWDFSFGNSLHPGRIRRWIIFLRNYKQAFMRSGIPLKLADWTSDEFEKFGKSPVREIRWRLFKFFSEERMSAMGPMTRPRTWILESVLNSEEVREVIQQAADEQERPVVEVREEAALELNFMAADYKYSFIVMASWLLRRTLGKLYNPIVLDKEGLNRVRDMLKQRALIYVPSHKSHVDYLAWSWMLNENNMYPPHIIAGENLSFWPMGFLFRRMGALFMRRSFKGNRVYSTLLRRYLTYMLNEGYSQEFFIEGTRSRTGKLLQPKLGILSFYIDSFVKNPDRDMVFAPVSIIYDKLIEEGSHSREMAGGRKEKESTSSLLKIPNIFKLRYGAMYVNVGRFLSLKEWLEERKIQASDLVGYKRKEVIQEIGYDVIYRINECNMVTAPAAVSLALLASSRKGVAQVKLLDTIEIILGYLKGRGVKMSEALDHSLWAVSETIEMFRKDGSIQAHTIGEEIIYTINDGKRFSLDYYKNHILHYFAPAAFLAIAYTSFKKTKVSVEDLHLRANFLADLFRYEIVHPPRSDLDQLFDEAQTYFVGNGTFRQDSAGNLIAGEKLDRILPPFQNLFSNFLESYWLVAACLPHLLGKRMNEKKFLSLLMEEGKKRALIGELLHQEATSKPNFTNAINYFINRDILIRHQKIEDTSIVILPEDALKDLGKGDKASKKQAKKMANKKAAFIELMEAYESKDILKDVEDEIRFYLPN